MAKLNKASTENYELIDLKSEIADVVILTNSASNYYINLTKRAIETLRKSENNHSFNIIIIETNPEAEKYEEADICYCPNEPYNFSKFCNIGFSYCKNDIVVISNNDVEFLNNWYTNLRSAMILKNLDTASPKSPIFQKGLIIEAEVLHRTTKLNEVSFGYCTAYTFCGWCWAMNKKAQDIIFPMDEQFTHYFSDDDIIQRASPYLKHGLVGGSLVRHYAQESMKLIPEDKMLDHTWNLKENFVKKWINK